MKIKLLITGGTIDKSYNALTGALEFKDTHIPAMLKRARLTIDVAVDVLFLKDSLAMSDTDRQRIVTQCIESDEQHILITHGTDTLVETAQLLGEKINDKTLILFGSMIPYSVKNSDALFNFGVALNALKNQKKGVYVAMNGQVFTWDNVVKNTEKGIFQTLKPT